VSWNHRPSASPVTEFSPLAAVHVASAINAQLHPELEYMDANIDRAFLDRLGLAGQLDCWTQCCAEQASERMA